WAAGAGRNTDPLAGLGEVVHTLAGLGVGDNRAYRNLDLEITAIPAVTVASFAVRAMVGPEFWVVSELQECVQLSGRFHEDRAADATITPRWPSARHKFLSPKRCDAISSIATLDDDPRPIQKLHLPSAPIRS